MRQQAAQAHATGQVQPTPPQPAPRTVIDQGHAVPVRSRIPGGAVGRPAAMPQGTTIGHQSHAGLAQGTGQAQPAYPQTPPTAATGPMPHAAHTAGAGHAQAAAPPPVSATAELALGPGIRIGQYELIRLLGVGGMGQVYLARDTKLGRRVAIKFLLSTSHDFTERFLVEARATARCNHENIVIIHEVSEHQGNPYMVLEFLEGQELSDLLTHGVVASRRAVELMVPVVRALVRAHEFNLVHRDLKPDNIFVTESGSVKVLDFGIAKLFDDGGGGDKVRKVRPQDLAGLSRTNATQAGGIVGTMPYMSPEQWGAGEIDHTTDIWAVGIILWEMLTSRHPLDPISPQRLAHAAAMQDQPMPPIGQARPDIPGDLEQIIDRCLAKRKQHRFPTAQALLEALERLMPGRYGRRLDEGESPYPGLSAFQESDADRFFGRSKDIVQMASRLHDLPLMGVVGPSGVGKSSFVRAGVVPALKASGEEWEVLITRPGRDPLGGLASLLDPLTSSSTGDLQTKLAEHAHLVEQLRVEPGYMGTLLRARARQKRSHIMLFVDQFEELYTLVPDEAERAAYTACLAGMADDASTPLRVVVSMRSDFLDRASENREFMEQLTRGLLFLPAPDRTGLREALTAPLEMVGFRFESEHIVENMLDALQTTPGALPLLQFAAAKLWDMRDRRGRVLSTASYQSIGGIAGTLATHADQVLGSMTQPQQRLTAAIFQRLVTSENTRAIVDVADLLGLSEDPSEVQAVVDHLVQARLLVVQVRGDAAGPAVEIVHESLISSWPRLRRWLDANAEDSAFLEQLRGAAKQWAQKDKPVGLLWRGEAMEEARLFARRFKGDLAAGEKEYLDAVLALAMRATRRKRRLVIGVMLFLVGLVVAAGAALVWVRGAEQTAQKQKAVALAQRTIAEDKTRVAEQQKKKIASQLLKIQQETTAKVKAENFAKSETRKVKAGERKLAMTNDQLKVALKNAIRESQKARDAMRLAQTASKRAQKLTEEQKQLNKKLAKLLAAEKARVRKLQKKARTIQGDIR